jgi:hypothetical protein
MSRGWKFVVDHQMSYLRNSEEVVPAMEVAISKIERGGIEALAELLIVVAKAIDHPFSDQWIANLQSLQDGRC